MTRLHLHPYNPEADLRARAARALENFSREYQEIKDPGVTIEKWNPNKARMRRERRAAVRAAGGRPS